jgi:hypothetical protein
LPVFVNEDTDLEVSRPCWEGYFLTLAGPAYADDTAFLGESMVSMSQLINVLALLTALAAVASSSFLAWQALRLNQNANHLPIVLDALKPQRLPEFTRREAELWDELPKHDVALGFTNLPEPLRGHAFEVSCYYQHLSYLAEYGLADWDFIAVQTTYRLLRTWTALRHTFMRSEIIEAQKISS